MSPAEITLGRRSAAPLESESAPHSQRVADDWHHAVDWRLLRKLAETRFYWPVVERGSPARCGKSFRKKISRFPIKIVVSGRPLGCLAW